MTQELENASQIAAFEVLRSLRWISLLANMLPAYISILLKCLLLCFDSEKAVLGLTVKKLVLVSAEV